jgi:molybdenum cofactor cytidylyltransferase
VAEIVAAHTDLGDFCRLDEAAIVFLADKLVRDEELVTLEQRFKPALKRFRKDAAALESARRRLAVATAAAQAVEERLGRPLLRFLRESMEVRAHTRLPINLQSQEVDMA